MKQGMISIGVLAAMLLAVPAAAQDSRPATQSAELSVNARFTKDQFVKLTSKMLEVAELVRKTDPESATAITEAVNQARRSFIAENMDEVAEHLTRGLVAAAAQREDQVLKALHEVLEILRQGVLSLDERYKRIEEWKEVLKRIDELINRQKTLERQSRLTDKAGELDRRMKEHAAELADIVARQKELLKETGKLPAGDPNVRKLAELRDEVRKLIEKQEKMNEAAQGGAIDRLPALGEAQKHLAGQAEDLKGKVGAAGKDAGAEAAKSAASAADSVGKAGGEMNKASGELAKSDPAAAAAPQEQALADLKDAEKAFSDAIAKSSAGTPSGDLAQKQGGLEKRTSQLADEVKKISDEAGLSDKTGTGDSASQPATKPVRPVENLQRAAGHMNKAADNLTGQDTGNAAQEQTKALKELESQTAELADLHRQVMEKASQPTDKQAAEQKGLARNTSGLADQMKGSQSSSSSAPGQPSVEGAGKSMDSASGKLSQNQPGQANHDQNKALDDLEKARKELADAVAREEELAQAEQLRKIDELLDKVLSAQKVIGEDTKKTHEKRSAGGQESYQRPEQLKLTELSNGEGKLSEEVKKIIDMIAREGTAAVFPAVLEEVRGDLVGVQKRLADRQAGQLTQAVQTEIEKTLQELIDSVRKEMAERRRKSAGGGGSGGGGGGGGGGKQPLVPPIAELKMLRTMQMHINGRTAVLNEQKGLSPDEVAAQHKALAEREKKVKQMTGDLAAKMGGGARE